MEFNLDQAQELLNKGIAEAQEIVQNPSKVDELLVQLEEKLKAVPAIGETLADVPVMIAMVKAWIRKEYTVVSPKVIACLVGAIIYLLKKRDLIPDSIPLIGIADDLGVMGLALKMSEPELKAFAEWRANRGFQA
ncbi:MAG: DUF1232 domain-containing protein [Clostridia bacterium]|nr:DUF1232 domain-containing protein [Clostridia bacterium]MBR0387191.1 DUF1232 domain-containing protein [Clostridia bacterium]MBR2602043.1 DUF1232 domain-containing protein [Clostridia bacterium]MBR7174905.1 DUF1232 domain-containing protein [Clostridia bacterium]